MQSQWVARGADPTAAFFPACPCSCFSACPSACSFPSCCCLTHSSQARMRCRCGHLSGAELLDGDGEAVVVVACLDARPRPRDGEQTTGRAIEVAQLLLRVSPNAPQGDGSTSKRGGGRWG